MTTDALPVAQVAVDSGLPHLDRPFDYAVPPALSDEVRPGCRVRVRFAGRLVDGVVLARAAASEHSSLQPLHALVSPEQVLTPEVAALCRAVADRGAGSLYDVLRLAVPPRHARVEKEGRAVAEGSTADGSGKPVATAPPAVAPPSVAPPEPGSWSRYPAGPGFLSALAEGRSPRAVWCALPGPTWPAEVAAAVQACAASGRGAVVVVPDARDLDRVSAALTEAGVPHAALSAELGPAERYRRFLRVLRGEVRVAVGTRATAFAPVADLGLVVVWDDGDDLHAEPRAPYPHVRDVLVQRAHLTGAAALVGGLVRTAEGQLLLESGWARPLVADRAAVRSCAPAVDGTGDEQLARDPLAAAARLPATAFAAARAALDAGAPVLVQVPRRGYLPSLACARDRTPARCSGCAGPLSAGGRAAVPACRWCGRLAADWRCPACDGDRLRAGVVGARRTAEELGRAFPGTTVRTSGREGVLPTVEAGPALVISTPGAEPVADGGYGAVLLLDAWALLGRVDLRAGEEALRRWAAAAALARPAPVGRVVVVADRALPAVQALVRWDPAGAAERELAERAALSFPPAARLASLEGAPDAVRSVVDAVRDELAHRVAGPVAAHAAAGPGVAPALDVLGPVPLEQDRERVLLRVPRTAGAELAAALKRASGVRSARKLEAVRVELDPREVG